MTKGELFANFVMPVIFAALTGLAGYIGAQVKKLYEKYINDKTKRAVAQTCVKAVEQLYHDLGGPEKFKKAQEAVEEMLNEKGIPISELEMNLLIESVVSEFNYGFARAAEVSKPDTTLLQADEPEPPKADSVTLYSEEEGASL